MRVFIAINFAPATKGYLFNVQQSIKSQCLKGNFTLYNNFHITLRFIGKVDNHQSDKLCDLLDEVSSQIKSFEVQLEGIGTFKKGNKYIVWQGLSNGTNSLKECYNLIENAMEHYGFEKEDRGYKPHITLGREVVFSDSNLWSILPGPHTINVNRISLMLSHRVNGVLTYEEIYGVDL